MKKLVSFFVERSLLVNILTVGVIVAGTLTMLGINREAFPKVDYGYLLITTVYPGATPRDVEKHITIPIEDQLHEVDNLEEVNSSTIESRSIVIVKMDPDADNKDKIINDIKNAVDRVSDIPEEAEDSIYTELSSSIFSVLQVSLVKEGGVQNDSDERQLREHVRMLEDRLLDITEVARIIRRGYRDREMIVEVHPAKLDKYHIAINDVIMALSRKNLNFPGGILKTPQKDIMVRTAGEVEDINDIKNVLIRANDMGNWVTIGDVATVKDSFEEEKISNRVSGQKGITLDILKKESADIVTLVDQARTISENFSKQYKGKYKILYSNDMSYYVKRRLNVLKNNAAVGIVLVIISLLLTLGWRISLVTALGIPLSFCVTFIWMAQQDVTVSLVSMFGLIIVLGMLVDDAIVVAENVYRHLEMGKKPKDAVIDGTSEVIIPVAGTILTTIAAFAPIMFMGGIFGKAFWTLPAVVTVALIASWLESMFILPSHILDIEKKRKKTVVSRIKEGRSLYHKIREKYVSMLSLVLNHKYKFSLIITLFFLGTLAFASRELKFILFPKGGIDAFFIKVEAPMGTGLKTMNKKLAKVEKIVATLPESELEYMITWGGVIQEAPIDPNTKLGSNYGIILVDLTPEEDRERMADEIIEELREKSTPLRKEFTKMEFSHINAGGPPAESPVNVSIRGEDFDVLKKVSAEYKAYLKKIPGLKDVKDDYEEGKEELKIIVNEKIAAMAGISVYDIASVVRSSIAGTEATKIKKSEEEIVIRVQLPENMRKNPKVLKKVKISNRYGNLIPLASVAHFQSAVGIADINRSAWRRVIRVTADIMEKEKDVSSLSVNNMLMEKFKDIDKQYPGVIVSYEGEYKDSMESVENLGRSFIIAVIVIYIILVGLFRSLSHPIIIMGVIPLTSIGVIWAFYFHGLPFSFMALMGIVGLAGVIVNDSIVLVDFIKNSRAAGLSPREASLQAGRDRLRPVFLTTITTFLGIIPTAYGFGGFDPFLKPMAVAMAWGLAFGTVITLFVTPALYNIFSDFRKLFFKADKPAQAYEKHTISEIEEEMIKDDLEKEIRDNLKTEIEAELLNKLDKKKKKPSVIKKNEFN